ncbi:MAG: aminotransferase class I/II-fold pyridoxal phosphate-dependent enzyme [Ignavibacteriae bacterium]|nr:aminotransferase class I/II-fold pyridoxal phosphate-dependent enzyme [Ignavibacteriota bacterium]
MKTKIWLSSPHMSGNEFINVKDAFETNWIAPLGPHVNNFELELADYTGAKYAAALSAGTAALHLALIILGIERGDEVICQSFTFSASANPIVYQGATPVFVDSEKDTWNISPILLEEAIKDRIKKGKKPKAIIAVHLYGMPAKLNDLLTISDKYSIPIIEDAAEALGSKYQLKMKNEKLKIKDEGYGEVKSERVTVKSERVEGKKQHAEIENSNLSAGAEFLIHNSEFRKCGSFGLMSILSFNGNKIITTSGGGALLSDNEEFINKARFLATQARDNAPHYQHSNIGYNYRLSNVCAAIGRGQLKVLDKRVSQRRFNFEYYKNALSQIEGIEFQPEIEGSFSNRWLTAVTINPELTYGFTREDIRLELEKDNIESRPLWKPMHLQPIFENAPKYVNGTSEKLFEDGLCLPSGSNLTEEDLERIVRIVKKKSKVKGKKR